MLIENDKAKVWLQDKKNVREFLAEFLAKTKKSYTNAYLFIFI